MELDLVRDELNKYDEAIKNLIALRMSLIPIVADIKIKNDLPLFQGKREEEIYKKIEMFATDVGLDKDLLKKIYRLIIANALDIEHNIAQDTEKSVINTENNFECTEKLNENFQKLDNILSKEIPEIIFNINNSNDFGKLSLIQKSTLYYNNKINKYE